MEVSRESSVTLFCGPESLNYVFDVFERSGRIIFCDMLRNFLNFYKFGLLIIYGVLELTETLQEYTIDHKTSVEDISLIINLMMFVKKWKGLQRNVKI